MKKLFIIGDSFSWRYDSEKFLWPMITARTIEDRIGEKIEIDNRSLLGASQDFVWKKLSEIIDIITPNDFLVIVLTSADRFWFFENKPEHTNLMVVENIIQTTDDPSLQNILFGFVTKIWRPSLAAQLQNHRLGYLSYHVLKKGLRKPLILKAFDETSDLEIKFPDLTFSNRCLAKIQLEEFEKFTNEFTKADILLDKKYWHHIDCRYNHMCISNHKILGEMLGDHLIDSTSPDLASDKFHKGIITIANHKDKSFAEKEFYTRFFDEMISNSLRQKLGAKSFKLFF